MQVFEAVRTVLAVRQYQDTPVPPAIVRRIVEAGRLTGSSMNQQPWQFIVVEERATLRELGALIHTGPYLAQAPLAIVVAVEQTRYAVSDGSRAIKSMLLTAWGRRRGVELGWFYGDERGQRPAGYPRRAGSAGRFIIRLSGPGAGPRAQAAQIAGRSGAPRSLWPTVWINCP
ncbi:MAG: hypothetical protein FOGNACKC_04591 [Anaerolineae bacterium]|nr:hypothetical protein [Anaerolineae bacterium]